MQKHLDTDNRDDNNNDNGSTMSAQTSIVDNRSMKGESDDEKIDNSVTKEITRDTLKLLEDYFEDNTSKLRDNNWKCTKISTMLANCHHLKIEE